MTLDDSDTIVTAWAESAGGPGWINVPIWVLVRSKDGAHRVECLQPPEQSVETQTLYRLSEAAHRAMTDAVRRICAGVSGMTARHKSECWRELTREQQRTALFALREYANTVRPLSDEMARCCLLAISALRSISGRDV